MLAWQIRPNPAWCPPSMCPIELAAVTVHSDADTPLPLDLFPAADRLCSYRRGFRPPSRRCLLASLACLRGQTGCSLLVLFSSWSCFGVEGDRREPR